MISPDSVPSWYEIEKQCVRHRIKWWAIKIFEILFYISCSCVMFNLAVKLMREII